MNRRSLVLALMLGVLASSWADPSCARPRAAAMDSKTQMQTFIGYMKAGKKREADKFLQEVLAASPEKAGPYALLIGGMLAENGQHRDAVPLFEEAIRLSPDDPSAYFYLGVSYHALNEWTECEKIWDQLAERFPAHALTFYQAGLRHLKVDEFAEAKVSLQEAVERLEPDNPLRHTALATLALIDQKLAGG